MVVMCVVACAVVRLVACVVACVDVRGIVCGGGVRRWVVVRLLLPGAQVLVAVDGSGEIATSTSKYEHGTSRKRFTFEYPDSLSLTTDAITDHSPPPPTRTRTRTHTHTLAHTLTYCHPAAARRCRCRHRRLPTFSPFFFPFLFAPL